MVRWSFFVASLLSLLFWVGAVILFVRGIWYLERISYWREETDVYEVWSDDRGIELCRSNTGEEREGLELDEMDREPDYRDGSEPNEQLQLLGFRYEHIIEGSMPAETWSIDIPEWFLLIAP